MTSGVQVPSEGNSLLHRAYVITFSVLFAGCSGTIAEPSSGIPSEPGSSRPQAPLSCDVEEHPLRRLSAEELRNTMEDLFGDLLPSLSPPAFPRDPRPNGFDNDTLALVANRAFVEAQLAFSESVATAVADEALRVAGCAPSGGDAGCGPRFVDHWGLRVLRRPPHEDERRELESLFSDAAGGGLRAAAEVVLTSLLLMPDFSYLIPRALGDGRADPYTVASRLSYFLWGSLPDATLFEAAASGALATEEDLRREAERMLDDRRARRSVGHFALQWLHISDIEGLERSGGYDEALGERMKEESRRLVEYLVFDADGTVGDLFTTYESFLDGALAEHYGVPGPSGSSLERTTLTQARPGLLTRGGFLTEHAHVDFPSPVFRGVYVVRDVLCLRVGSPPPQAEVAAVQERGELVTNRNVYQAKTTDVGPSCAGCHVRINPPGFAFESFDEAGRFRTEDNGVRVDASGRLEDLGDAPFTDASELMEVLAAAPEVAECFARKVGRFATGGDPRATQCRARDVAQGAPPVDMSLREVLVATAADPENLRARTPLLAN